ncbi:MAG TPA: hypothetical protein VEX60_08425 [Pyrinomonadaceae bacterium]|nr:hypothetical protein [Pyrinomonadaceae bacterium]
MTGLGEEVVTRCPTCGYGLTARKYAVPKECPLCRGSFDAEAAPAPQLTTAQETEQLTTAQETEKENVVEDKVKDAVAEEREENEEPRESRITLSVKPDVETGPLGLTTLRMPDAESEDAPPESKESAPEETAAPVEPLEAEMVEPQPSSREPASPPQGAHIEHATPAASARAEAHAYTPPTTKMDTFQTPPSSQPSWSQPSSLPSSSQPTPQPVRTAHARGSLEERVSPEVVGRYADAYRTARATVLIGNLIKVFGVLLGLLVGGGLFALAATQGRIVGGTGVIGFFAGLLVGGSIFAFFFVLGVVVSAQGQLIKATLDGAVNSSPFLTNDQRAEAMSLR